MIFPRTIRIERIASLLGLYVVLVFYSAAYEHFYAYQLTPLFNNANPFIVYDFSRQGIYTLIQFLTPLAILPMGARLRAPGQFIIGALAIFIFIPIPIVFVPMVTATQFWHIYSLLWVGYFAACTMSSFAIRISLPIQSERRFGKMMIAIYTLFCLGFAFVLATNRVAVVGLAKAHEAREGVTITGWQAYMLVAYITSFGGLLVALAIMFRKYHVLILAAVGYLVCYATLEERNAAIMPAWIAFIYGAHKLFFRDSVTKYMITVMTPFICGSLFASFIGTENRHSILYAAFMLANYRLYSVSALAFNVYFNFFQTHPLTYWAHINLVSKFVQYPYGAPLALVMADAYHMGNYNAAFLETDGLAAAGTTVLPFISIVFGLALAAINSCMRDLNLTMCAILTAGSSVALIDTGIGPGLLTNGLALLAVIMLFAPRDGRWRQLHRDA